MSAALKLDPPPSPEAAARLRALRELPLSDEPPTAEEIAIFDQLEADVRAGKRGHTTEEILEDLEQMRRDERE